MTARPFLIIGIGIYVLSWFLPAMTDGARLGKAKGNDPLFFELTIRGWWAFCCILSSKFDLSWKCILARISASSNLLLIAVLAYFVQTATRLNPLLTMEVFLCAILNFCWTSGRFNEDNDRLTIGYYLWAGSFMIISIVLLTIVGEGCLSVLNGDLSSVRMTIFINIGVAAISVLATVLFGEN